MVDVYESFLCNVREFQDISALPTNIFFQNVAKFATHHASWHKSCHLKYNNSKLAKVKKRTIDNADNLEKTTYIGFGNLQLFVL